MNNSGCTTLHIGFNNAVLTDKLIAVISIESNPAKRLTVDARAAGKLIDATHGRRTRAVLVMLDGYVVLSAVMPETLVSRIDEAQKHIN